jgi:predicted O-methyltransferase YrrM
MGLFQIKSYLKYRASAKGKHGVHSPFVYHLLEEILVPGKDFYAFEQIEEQRSKLLHNGSVINVTDYGAGSKSLSGSQRAVRDIARRSLKAPKYAQILFRLIVDNQPNTIIELGTSLGITSLYMAAARPTAEVITFEGCPEISKIAASVFEEHGQSNIRQVIGPFRETLVPTLEAITNVDLAFVDGHHLKAPTIEYTRAIMDRCHENSVIVLDDIHWSAEMKEAWDEILTWDEVITSVDLFEMGLIFLDPSREKQHFVLKA